MTTTDLYSGYTTEGKPSSRVLRPPGGESSNIFGEAEPTRQQQMRQEMPPQEGQMQPPGARQTQNPTVDANQQYQKNKPSGKAEAPFAMFAESGKASVRTQFDNCVAESQKDADFRSYSVSDYHKAVVQNAAVRQRAHGQATGAFNPITHEEYPGSSPCKDFDQRRAHPQQVAQQQQQQQPPVRMVRGQGNHDMGKGKFNPITGEEYPADYGQKTTDEDDAEEQETDETDDANKQNDNGDNTPDEKTTTPPAPSVQSAAAPAPFVKVRQPPGGKSSGLW